MCIKKVNSGVSSVLSTIKPVAPILGLKLQKILLPVLLRWPMLYEYYAVLTTSTWVALVQKSNEYNYDLLLAQC